MISGACHHRYDRLHDAGWPQKFHQDSRPIGSALDPPAKGGDNFFCTLSKTLIVANLVSSTTSSYKAKNKSISISTEFQLKPKSPDIFQRDHLTSNSHPHSDEVALHMVFSWNSQKWSLLTRKGMRPRYHSAPTIKTMSLNRLYYHQVSDPMTEALAISGLHFLKMSYTPATSDLAWISSLFSPIFLLPSGFSRQAPWKKSYSW